MATTTNYSWETPDDTDLVKDGAAAIRTLGSSIDTTTKALNPSTTLGDIEYRSATANTNTRLGIGSTGQVLTVTGGVPTWSSPAGGGKVLQVVSFSTTTTTTVTATSLTDTNITATITPSSATSKILVLSSIPALMYSTGSVNQIGMGFALLRGSTMVFDDNAGGEGWYISTSYTGYHQISDMNTINFLDSPATTSATTYKIQVRVGASNVTAITSERSRTSSMILMEIGA